MPSEREDDWQLTYEHVKPHGPCCEGCKAQRERAGRAEATAMELAEAAKDVVEVWHKPPRVDSLADLDSAIDELAITLSKLATNSPRNRL